MQAAGAGMKFDRLKAGLRTCLLVLGIKLAVLVLEPGDDFFAEDIEQNQDGDGDDGEDEHHFHGHGAAIVVVELKETLFELAGH
jgi:hypothetical protein